jgi:hypothetical protein
MPLTPPLDKVPKLPVQLTSLIVDAIVDFINSIIENLNLILEETTKLPDNVQCDDPRIKNIEDQLARIQELILKLQEFIPFIEKALVAIQTTVTIANSIKAIQMLNPITGPVILAMELVLAQNVYNRLGQACTDKEYQVTSKVKDSIDNLQKFNANVSTGELPDGGLPSEFYREVNVSKDDIEQRLDLIKELIDSQQDLLTSLQEAPAQSYNGTTPPDPSLGKSGDYFIDTAAKQIYGPKTNTGWPTPVNY